MRLAMREEDPAAQAEFVESSMTGKFDEKFGAMLGMLYLAQEWIKRGNLGLNELFQRGYEGFLSRILKSDEVKKEGTSLVNG